jgi:DNA polymerase IV (archaeal DinB-like DNA polymerase)
MNPIILHLDFDYFFAQCEEIRHPETKGKPIVICVYSGRGPDSGAVSTANYIAREKGVRAGVAIAFAKRTLSDALFFPVDLAYYKSFSSEIIEHSREYGSALEQVSIDEFYLDITEKVQGDYKKAKSLARSLKQCILDTHSLTCSIGIGPNKLIAKIASDFEKPDGLTVIHPLRVQSFLDPLPASTIPGIGKKSGQKLNDHGVETIAHLRQISVEKLVSWFGNSWGERMYHHARGEGSVEINEDRVRKQFSRIMTLKRDTRDSEELAAVIDYIASALEKRLQKENARFKTISIICISSTLKHVSRAKTIEKEACDAEIIKKIASELLHLFFVGNPTTLRRLGVSVSNLEYGKKVQKTLGEF